MSTFLGSGPLSDATGARVAAVMMKYEAPGDIGACPPGDVFGVPKVACNFADPDYQYPTHTAAAAWVSAATYHDTGSEHPHVAARIKAACEFHRLWGEWDRLEQTAKEAREKTAKQASVRRWALPAERKYPLDTPEQVKLAGDYFMRYADALTDADRRTFAAETAKAAHAVGWGGKSQDLQLLEAEGGLCRPAADPKIPFLARAKYASDKNLSDLAAALMKAAEAAGIDPVADAAVLRRIDKRAGWNYGNPIHETTGETVTAVRQKIASAARAASGNWYNVSDLRQLPTDLVTTTMGVGPVVSEPLLRGLLTDPTKAASFEQVLRDAGVRPVSTPPRRRVDWAAEAQSV
jgi:hypothetical protein